MTDEAQLHARRAVFARQQADNFPVFDAVDDNFPVFDAAGVNLVEFIDMDVPLAQKGIFERRAVKAAPTLNDVDPNPMGIDPNTDTMEVDAVPKLVALRKTPEDCHNPPP